MRINSFGYCSSNASLLDGLKEAMGITPAAKEFIEPDLKKQLRTTGAFITAGVRAAVQALSQVSISEDCLSSSGIIVTSSIGDQNTTSEFIDELFEYGANQGSPLKFAHSIHNAAASYVATHFKIHGPAFTSVNFDGAFGNGLTLARCLIDEKVCENVLLLQIESCSMLTRLLLNYKKNRTFLSLQNNETAKYSDSKAQCVAACFLLSGNKITLNASQDIFISSSEQRCVNEFIPAIESPLTDSLQLLSAILNDELQQYINISDTTYLIEK